MKRVITLVLLSVLAAPMFVSGCACDDGSSRMRQQSGGK